MNTKERKITRGERWTKKCRKCRKNFIPNEYKTCDCCFMGQFKFNTTFDALDHLGMDALVPYDEVLRVLRLIKDKRFVSMHGT